MSGDTDLAAIIERTERRIAELQKELEIETGVLERLRLLAKDLPARQKPMKLVLLNDLPLHQRIVRILRFNEGPMRAKEIDKILTDMGFKTENKLGLIPAITTALHKHKDLFVQKSRGVYDLVDALKQKPT